MKAEHKQALVDEIAIQALRDGVRQWQQRAEAAEAKLAGLDKQRNPDYFLNRIESSDKWGPEVELRIYESQLDASKSQDDHGGGIIELFTRPAPAADYVRVQEAWEACGGNPGIKATREELLEVLRLMDETEDEMEAGKPAADLAELVPDAKAIRKEAGGYAPVYSLQEQQLFIDGATWLSAAILAKLEINK